MRKFEKDYAALIEEILECGEERKTRNGKTRGVFGRSLTVPVGNFLPLIQGRKMFPKGVIGEFAAFMRQPTCVEDFERWGCNYWKTWANEEGKLNVDYGNAWFADGQIDRLKDALKNNPTDRRMIINGWRPAQLDELDLPCCHYSYQFYVREGKFLDMIWTQRSVDMMIGLPSDILLAAVWLITLAAETGYTPGRIKLDLGDCHIYEEHLQKAEWYCRVVDDCEYTPVYYVLGAEFTTIETFEPSMLRIGGYEHASPISFELKA